MHAWPGHCPNAFYSHSKLWFYRYGKGMQLAIGHGFCKCQMTRTPFIRPCVDTKCASCVDAENKNFYYVFVSDTREVLVTFISCWLGLYLFRDGRQRRDERVGECETAQSEMSNKNVQIHTQHTTENTGIGDLLRRIASDDKNKFCLPQHPR